MDGITTRISKLSSDSELEAIRYCKQLIVKIDKAANVEYYECGIQKPWYRKEVFKRLMEYNDIVDIKFETYDNKECEDNLIVSGRSYYIEWTGDSRDENKSQSSFINKDGDLCLVVDCNKNAKNWFAHEN